jgi:hypothetical protein
MKAIIAGGHIENMIQIYANNPAQTPFVHMIVSGPSGRAIARAVDPEASGLFIFGHPTLGDWSAVPANFKNASGGPLHFFVGSTPASPAHDPEEDEEAFFECNVHELYVLGEVSKYVNGTARDGSKFIGIKISDSSFVDAILPAKVAYRDDTMQWSEVDPKYRRLVPQVDGEGNPIWETPPELDPETGAVVTPGVQATELGGPLVDPDDIEKDITVGYRPVEEPPPP